MERLPLDFEKIIEDYKKEIETVVETELDNGAERGQGLNSNELSKILSDHLEKMEETVVGALNEYKANVDNPDAGKSLTEILTNLREALMQLIEDLKQNIRQNINGVKQGLGETKENAIENTTALKDKLKNNIENTIFNINNKAKDILNVIPNAIDQKMNFDTPESKLKAELNELTNENTQLKGQNHSLTIQVKNLTTEVDELKLEIQQLKVATPTISDSLTKGLDIENVSLNSAGLDVNTKTFVRNLKDLGVSVYDTHTISVTHTDNNNIKINLIDSDDTKWGAADSEILIDKKDNKLTHKTVELDGENWSKQTPILKNIGNVQGLVKNMDIEKSFENMESEKKPLLNKEKQLKTQVTKLIAKLETVEHFLNENPDSLAAFKKHLVGNTQEENLNASNNMDLNKKENVEELSHINGPRM